MKKTNRNFPSTAKCKANRKNSLKSTGPKTPIGKRNSRLNALKHAFYAEDLIIRPENEAEIERLRSDLHAQMLPETALQELAFKTITHCAWQLELAARLDMRQVNASLFPPDEEESSRDTHRSLTMDSWYYASLEDLRKGIGFLDWLKQEVERCRHVPEELKDSVRKGFGPGFLDLLEQPKSPISLDALHLAHHLTRHAKTFGKPLPPQLQEGPESIIDPQQTLQSTLKLIELMKEFLDDLRRISRGARERATQLSAGDSPPRHFADATRGLRRAVTWFQYLVTNNL